MIRSRPCRGPVALVTCAAVPTLGHDDRLLARALAVHGIGVVPAVWDRPGVPWHEFSVVLLRSCWDYHLKRDAFSDWLGRIEAGSINLWNPVETVRWNADKVYLRELAALKIESPETVWVFRGTPTEELPTPADYGWSKVVIKPSVSASAHMTYLVEASDVRRYRQTLRALAAESDVLVQPYVAEVTRDGEWSLCYIGGDYSHAVLKRPRPGDFRVQPQFGGTARPVDVPRFVRAAADHVLDSVAHAWVYARVDGVVRDGRFLLMELELIEPCLYLGARGGAARRLADVMMRRWLAGGDGS